VLVRAEEVMARALFFRVCAKSCGRHSVLFCLGCRVMTEAINPRTSSFRQLCWKGSSACPGGKVGLMAVTTNPKSFEEIVEWAYTTLPQKIRDLPDFPGIQVVDEPPADVLEDISNRKKWRRGTELLGLYSGTLRTKRSFTQVKYAPDLIFVFRGPILRCSKGDLRAEVKRVVWHEVAH
jgi:predicted Zn-dependent protease with MMP-like domain